MDMSESIIKLVSVVIPAYNEARSIGTTLEEIITYFARKPYALEVIVVADGNDGTRELVREMRTPDGLRLTVIGDQERRGKGYGVRKGIFMAKGDIVGFVDADNKTPIEEFSKFEVEFAKGADIVIGSRGYSESHIDRPQPIYRQIGARLFSFGMHTVIGLRQIPDTQCGFKFFRRTVALDIFNRQYIDGYMFDVEILHLASLAKYHISQVPVHWRDDADSRLKLVHDNIRNIVDIFRIRFSKKS